MNLILKLTGAALISTISLTSCAAQLKNVKTEEVKIYGNCGMCEQNIETAGSDKKTAVVDWNVDTKMAVIKYDSTKTTLDDILKSIAYVGYDSDVYRAPDEVYNSLHGCCKYDRPIETVQMESTTHHGNHETVDPVVTTEEVAEVSDVNMLNEVYANYFSLKDALTRDDFKTAAENAAALIESVKTVKQDQMNTEQKAAWTDANSDLTRYSELIAGAKDIDEQRKQFALLSAEVYALVSVFGNDEPMYYMHCPMYNNGKGANWLSEESVIKNPYYGSQMLSCGSLKSTIE